MFKLHIGFDGDFENENKKEFPFWGVIYVETGNICFPFDGWDDFLSDVLSMWLHDTAEFISGRCKIPCDLYFMDGPHQIRLLPINQNNIISAELISNRGVVEAVDDDIHFQEFIQQMLDASQALLADERTHKFIAATRTLKWAREMLLDAIKCNKR